MKIGYFADGPWSHKSLEKIIEDPRYEIAFIVPRFENQDPILKLFAKKLNVDFLVLKNVNSIKSLKILESYNADLFVSMSFNQIIKKNLINSVPKGFINCHAGKLPFYRGRNVLNWVLINGEKDFGITVHYIDEGIDTGDIILQKTIQIEDCDNYGTLLEKAYANCAELLVKSLNLIINNNVNVIKQNDIHPQGSYCRGRKEGDEILDWKNNCTIIHNFVRALTIPGPCARTFLNNTEIMLYDSEKLETISEEYSDPGTVLEVKKNKLIIKTATYDLLITKYSIIGDNYLKIKKGDILS